MGESLPRKVSVAELFYDLIYVYAIGRITAVISTTTENGYIPIEQLGKFLMLNLIFWIIWSYQTVYSNRFFEKRFRDYIFIFLNMFIMIILSQSINSDFQETFRPFVGATMGLLVILGIQYFLKYLETDSEPVKRLCLNVTTTVSISVGISAISLFVSPAINFWVYFVAMTFVAFFPLIFGKALAAVPTDFEHLAERYSLFIILLFGESIIAIANTITYKHVSLESFLFFLIIVMMFSIYMLIYSEGLNHHMKTGALMLIYNHLFLFISIGLNTVLLELYMHHHLDTTVFVVTFFISTILFVKETLAILNTYKKAGVQYRAKDKWFIFSLLIGAGGLSYLLKDGVMITFLLIAVVLSVIVAYIWRVLLNGSEIAESHS